jgi:hypothetical protein
MLVQSFKARQQLGLRRVLVAIVMIGASFASALAARPAHAQSVSWIEFVGATTAVSGSTITVDNLLVDVSKAEVKVTLAVGRVVKVEGYLLSPAKVQATEVKAAKASDDDDGESELVGRLDATGAGTMRIAGLTFNMGRAVIKGNPVIGMLVKVHYRLVSGVRVAREVEPFVPGDDDDDGDISKTGEVEIFGTISQMGSRFIVVNATRITTTGAEIKVALRVGVRVKVHMRFTGSAFVAREIEAALDDDDQADDDDKSGKGGDDKGGDDKGSDDDSSGKGGGGDDDSGSDSPDDDSSGDSDDDDSGGDDDGGDDD